MAVRLTEADKCLLCVLYLQQGDTCTLKTVHSLKAKQLHKWPQLSPRNRPTHSRDASIEFVVMMERGWQWPDLETLLLRRPLEGPKAAVDSQLMPFG